MKSFAILALGLWLTAACSRDKTTDVGNQGMNAAAEQAASATANPVIDNPNVVQEEAAPNPNAPVLTFAEQAFDFGDIAADSKVRHTFRFTNTGKSALLIADATASCGCTTPNWTKEPVAPGGTGKMEVQFDSRGKHGLTSKTVSVRANTQPSITTITIKGNVLDAGEKGPAL